MKNPKTIQNKTNPFLYKIFMIHISKQELMKSTFSWNEANALDVTVADRSILQNISVGVSQLISFLSSQANLFKLLSICFMHFICIISSSTEQTPPTYHSFLKITAIHCPTLQLASTTTKKVIAIVKKVYVIVAEKSSV